MDEPRHSEYHFIVGSLCCLRQGSVLCPCRRKTAGSMVFPLSRVLLRVCITDHDVSGEPGFSDGKLSYLAYVKETCPTTVEEHCQVTRVMRLTSGFLQSLQRYVLGESNRDSRSGHGDTEHGLTIGGNVLKKS